MTDSYAVKKFQEFFVRNPGKFKGKKKVLSNIYYRVFYCWKRMCFGAENVPEHILIYGGWHVLF